MHKITPLQLDFLRLLNRTGFATNKHLEQVSIGKNPTKNSQSHLTKGLLSSNHIGRVNVVSGYGVGKRVMYFLTKRGAEFIAEIDGTDPENTPYTAGKQGEETEIIRADFPHKEKYISCFLELEKYLEGTDYLMREAYHYYQRSKGGTTLTIKGRNFRPDGICFLESINPDHPRYAYVIEIHRHSDRKKIITQLRQHAEAYEAGSLKNRFGINHPYFVLSVFAGENVAVMRSVIQELQQDPKTWAYMEKFFMFGELDAIMKKGIYESVAYFGGNKKPFPPKEN
jgi:hypothetical protein